MRVNYILPVVIAALLQVSGCALLTTKEINQVTLANVASPDVHNVHTGRALRVVNKDDAEKEELVQEERSALKNFGKATGKYLKRFGKWFVKGDDFRIKDVGGRSWF
ncbi:hypothetical protein L914_07409 [Phytophthora nicotianae]|uniref:RxLR effector protein n=1 Tax=Phytophthora nicotianae TaxID=4792 RepID=W2J7M0_PHYNI|nr:hypothetical protein L916_07452 [Phytophthora nicotianae]ETM48002.1 hypothetical protein L914_07409 [Phytophthora nicotianae]